MKLLTSALTEFYYGISVVEIDQVPFAETPPDIGLLRTLYDIGGGNPDVSMEFLRIAGAEAETQMRHFFVLRTMDADAANCYTKARLLYQGIYKFLTDREYRCHEVDYREFSELYAGFPRDQACFLCRDIRRDHTGLLNIPRMEKADIPAVYAALNGSGCMFSVHITPDKTSSAEFGYLHSMRQLYRNYSSDPAYANALNMLAQRSAMPHAFHITMCLSGGQAAEMAPRLTAALGIPTVMLPADRDVWSMAEQPWIRNKFVDEQLYQRCRSCLGIGDPPKYCGLFTKFIPVEAAQLLTLPVAGKGYIGTQSNLFSLLSRSAVWDKKLTEQTADSLTVGLDRKGKPLYLPLNELPRGVGIFGMNGVGKSVWLLSAIRQLQQKECPIFVLAGSKYEMRKLIKQFRCRLCTPGVRDISPMKINLFEVPKGSTVARHKNAVVSALVSAIDMPPPLDSLLLCAVDETYRRFGYQSDSGWEDGTAFSVRDFIPIYKNMLADCEYAKDVKGNLTAAAHFRLLAYLQRADGMIDTLKSFDVTQLINNGVSVVELEGLDPCDRKVAAFLILTAIMAHIKMLPETNGKLRMAIVVDEMHTLLASGREDLNAADRLVGQSILDLLTEMISVMRSRGIGLIYSDQSIHRLGGNTLFDQTVNKLLFRLEGQENHLAAQALHFTEKEAKCLLNLGVGQALFKSGLDMEAIGVNTVYANYGDNVSDEELRQLTKGDTPKAQTDPAAIAVDLLNDGDFPTPEQLFRVWNGLDIDNGKAVGTQLEYRAMARGVQIPQEYPEVKRRYFAKRQGKA